MNRTTFRAKSAVLALALLAPALMAPNCFFLPTAVTIEAPVEGQVFEQLTIPVRVVIRSSDDDLAQVRLDGVDVLDQLAIETVGFDLIVTGTLTVATTGPHVLTAAGAGGLTQDSDLVNFTVTMPVHTPSDVVTGIVGVGEEVTVRGQVAGVSYKVDASEDREPQRYVLLHVPLMPGLTLGQIQWGLGARLSDQQWRVDRIALPYPGDVVEVTGTVGKELFRAEFTGDEERFVLNPVTEFELVSSPNPVLADIGDACTHDMDCRDDLICNRHTLECELFAPISWGGDPRGVNAACDTDDDCPIGQICTPGYTIRAAAEDPLFGAHYAQGRDTGRKMCNVPDRGAPAAEICPRTVTTDDLASGRFAEGKEICLRGQVFLSWFNPGDRDSHCQVIVKRPLTYPEGNPPMWLGQVATEVAPPQKDPLNPQGVLADLPPGKTVTVLGTVKFDDSHIWYEIHPYKWFAVTP